MRTALVGAVESSAAALAAMVDSGHAPHLVVALPAERKARHSDYADLVELSATHGLAAHPTTDINEPETIARLKELDPDIVFVLGWSQICGPEFLEIPAIGCIGFHPSALPQNRGRAVLPWTIIQGLEQTGASLFWLAEGMDDGDIVAQEKVGVDPDETARSLYDKHAAALQSMLRAVLPQLAGGDIPRHPQDHSQATYCAKRVPGDGRIDWDRPARELWTLIRATGAPYPGAFSYYDDRKVTVWAADLIGAAPHWASPGQIVAIGEEGSLVHCGDGGHLLLRNLEFADEDSGKGPRKLKLHDRFRSDEPAKGRDEVKAQ